MKKIGVSSELISETSYHVWPLFKEFRESDLFLSAYEEIYGHPFKYELQRRAEVIETSQLSYVTDATVVNGKPSRASDQNDTAEIKELLPTKKRSRRKIATAATSIE